MDELVSSMGLNWVGTGNLNLDHCIHCRTDKAAAVVAGLLLELCRKDLEFYVTKRKGEEGGILPVELCFITC